MQTHSLGKSAASVEGGGAGCTVEVYVLEESEERITVLRVGTQQGGGSSKSDSCQEF